MNRITKAVIISLLLILFTPMAKLSAQVSVWDGTWEPWTHGTGTEADPFLIENAQQLAYLAYRVNNGLDAGGGHVSNHDYHYKLMVDVDLNGSENFQWTPIGYWNSETDYQCFGGVFDGNGHAINELYINSSADRVGFWSYINGATIENMQITNGFVSKSNSGSAGVLVGQTAGNCIINNCHNNSNVFVEVGSCAGGIIGLISGGSTYITNCHNNGIITSCTTGGGIVGSIRDCECQIQNCYNTGDVSVIETVGRDWRYVGGIAGVKNYGDAYITNCYNVGNVSLIGPGGYYWASGILGANNAGYSTITNCYNVGSITSSGAHIGGISWQQVEGGGGGGSVNINNSYYLNTCGGTNPYGGEPKTATYMKSPEFVNVLNNGTEIWMQDIYNVNQGYPVFSDIIYVSVSTTDATNITQTHSTLNGTAYPTEMIVSTGFEYKRASEAVFHIINVSGSGSISTTLSGLEPNTQYSFRAFCITQEGNLVYGQLMTFNTLAINVTTSNATDVTQTHATLNGNINFGDASITSQGFEYKKTSDSEYQTVVVSGGGSISTTLSDLTPNTQYRFRAFCTPQEGSTIYGQEKTFNTLTINVTTYSASNVTESSATLNGHIDTGDAEVTDKGFKYWPAYDPQNVSTVSVSTTGNISATINNLAQNIYQYRAFVESNGDTYQGGIKEFEISWLNNDTIFVYDADKLHWVAEQCNSGVTFEGKCVKLMNDIELPLNVPNNMISIGSYPSYPFKGTFDGNGKLITNLYIDQPNTPYQGFFGYTLNANLYNVGLVNITASGRNYTGGMVAYAENTYMRDCYVNGGTLFALSYCGGLVGYQEQGTNSIISGCYNTCEVTGNNYVGGLIGFSNYSTVRNSYVAGRVAAQGEPVGAIIGGANEVLMYYCYFSIELTGQAVAIGENNFKDGEGLTNEQMRDPQFVATLNQGLVTPVWKPDYEIPINNGFPIIMWQEQDIIGIEEANVDKSIVSLYPNPANGKVTIEGEDIRHITISNLLGQTIFDGKASGNAFEYDFSKHKTGIYLIRVETANGVAVKKVSVTR